MTFLVYLLVYPILWLISRLPFRLLYALSDGIFFLLYYAIGYRKTVVRENLALVFPDKAVSERIRIEKAFFKHMCDMFLEMIKTMGISHAQLQKRFTFENLEVLHTLEAKLNSVMSMYGILSDQSPMPQKAQLWAEFMGIRVPVHTGAESLCRKHDLPAVFLKVKKVKRGHYSGAFHVISENPNSEKEFTISKGFLALVEQSIKEAPEYYFWTHKRWKHRDKNPEDYLPFTPKGR